MAQVWVIHDVENDLYDNTARILGVYTTKDAAEAKLAFERAEGKSPNVTIVEQDAPTPNTKVSHGSV